MTDPEKTFGVINDIQRMSTNDGPGFRTIVFLKGCLLDCKWCHNPEGRRRFPEIIPFVTNCIGCGECLEVCATGALSLNGDNHPVIDRGLCTDCLQCARVCTHAGLVPWGTIMTASEVMKEVFADEAFFRNSGGGMTVSGGEPMAQPGFVHALFSMAKQGTDQASPIHTALDTCGHAPWEDYAKVLPFTDLVLLDIKHMNPEPHKTYTGATNALILNNARRMAEMGTTMRLRVPIIPGINDTQENWSATAEFAASLGDSVQGVDLLPYHPYAGGKYKAFGMDYDFPAGEGYDDSRLEPVIELFLKHVYEVTIGG
ncbi:MAG: glycyl-radical enzyme activating protein [Desulfatibacillum sp.]|nr:glycyl-radical enzyme activating protein [Desulfatibacillum sp.]